MGGYQLVVSGGFVDARDDILDSTNWVSLVGLSIHIREKKIWNGAEFAEISASIMQSKHARVSKLSNNNEAQFERATLNTNCYQI